MQQESSPGGESPPAQRLSDSPVNFYLRKQKRALCSHKLLLRYQNIIAREVKYYRDVLEANGSLAKNSGVSLFSSRTESRVCDLFSTACPRVLEPSWNESEIQSATHISWTDLLQREISASDFQQTSAGDYICSLGDLVVQMSKMDRDLICSGFISRLLHSSADPTDMRVERSFRKSLIEDSKLLYVECLNGNVSSSHPKFHQLTNVVMEHIESIMSRLGEDVNIPGWLDLTEPNCDVETSQAPGYTKERGSSRPTRFVLDACKNSLDSSFSKKARSFSVKPHPKNAPRKTRGYPKLAE